MQLTGRGLLVSLPAREMAAFRPSGSLFKEDELRKADLSEDLRSALVAVRQLAAKVPLLFVARPELFTYGESLAWLRDRLGPINDHVCLSDGYSVRPIPDLKNHLFLYKNPAVLHKLTRFAPELLRSFDSVLDGGVKIRAARAPAAVRAVKVARRAGRSAERRPKITIDVQPLLDPQWTGIPVFTWRLIEALRRTGSLDLRYALEGQSIDSAAISYAIQHSSGAFLRDALGAGSAALNAAQFDRSAPMLFPSVKIPDVSSYRQASTIHDLSTLFMPETHEDTNVAHHLSNLQTELRQDEVVFCVSEATKAAVTCAYPSIASKLQVISQYVEWPEDFALLDRNLPAVKCGRYAVVVGTIEPRKNLALLREALASPEIARSDIQFVVIGRVGWLMEQFLDKLTAPQRARLVFTGFITEFAKYRLIRHAEFLVYPSLYEGFGIPAVEAMSLGKPVLAARTSSFPEIIGAAGVYFDPVSVADFASAFQEIQHPAKLAELGPKALAQSRQFHWRRMAEPVVRWATG